MNGELPKGWVWTSLGEVTENPQYGWTTRAITEGELHLLRTTDITSGKIDWNSVPFCEEEPENIGKYLLEDGDIVISRAGSVGYSYLLKNPEKSIFASYLIRFKPLINRFFLYYFLKSPSYWEAISEKSIGIAMANVNASKLKQIEIPLPPLAEQQRIVNKIEELFTNLDKGVESLNEVKYKLKIYRQAILKYAMEGKLTEKWREENKDKINDSDINIRNNLDIKNLELDKFSLINSNFFEISNKWVWRKIGDICILVNGRAFKPSDWSTLGLPIIRIQNLNNINSKYNYCNFKVEDKYYIDNDDLLFGWSGTPGTSFGAHIWKGGKAILNQHIFKVIINNKYIEKRFFYHLLNYNVKEYIKKAHGTAGLAHITKGKFENSIVQLPPLEEQNIIVERIEKLFSLADYIEETVDSKLEQSKPLRQSILKKAFEGKLVPQDPNDEPAEILLEKIKKQKLNKEKLVQEKLV